ncbi:mitochondrial acidic protein mam33 [Penicillium ochrochloron]
MLSLRALTRSVPRFSRSIARTSLRPTTLAKPAIAQPWKQTIKPAYAAFSTTSVFREPAGEGDVELIAKLDEELKHEKASGQEDAKEQQASIDYTLEAGQWQVKDVEGEQEVILTKTFGNETIRVTFTVADINNLAEDPMDELADDALADEGDYQNKPAEGEDEILPPTFPARINVTIEKPSSGALLVQAVIQDGDLQIEEISHFKNAEIANAQTAEKDWSRQSFYAGPPAENLDPELLAFWGRYLEERGLNLEFQNMVTDYIAFKEQKEYVRWLDNVRKFVAA